LIKIKSSQVTKEVGEGYAYTSIQAAIEDAGYGEMILVHDGTYMENINFKGKGINVFSENGAASTIIDGSGSGSVVTFDYGENKDSELHGFTIQNGSANNGSGIYCYRSSPTIINCTIDNNTAEDDGGGIYCYGSSPMINNCSINSNTAEDGGGGIYCRNYSSPMIINCTIIDNIASYGGGIYCYRSSPTIINCTICKNIAEYNGGVIYCESYSSPTITNCTISKNMAEYNGGSIYCDSSSSLTITNCILCNNSPQEIDANPTVTYSDIKQDTGIYPGESNINADPLFVGSEVGNYYLMPGSPCIDTGTSTNAPSDRYGGIRIC
jgi:parallel beta-helix repeat protein/predicted outer membrane repeat protein